MWPLRFYGLRAYDWSFWHIAACVFIYLLVMTCLMLNDIMQHGVIRSDNYIFLTSLNFFWPIMGMLYVVFESNAKFTIEHNT